METDLETSSTWEDPLDEVEQFLSEEQIPFERPSEAEIQFSVTGTWCEYPMWFRWLDGPALLQVGLGIDTRVPENRRSDVADLVVQINERLLVGHFDMWSGDRTLVFRHGQLFEAGQAIREPLIRKMSAAATEAAEYLVPALNFLLWSDKTVSQAVEAAMFDTVGEA